MGFGEGVGALLLIVVAARRTARQSAGQAGATGGRVFFPFKIADVAESFLGD